MSTDVMEPAMALTTIISDLVELMTPEQRGEAAARVNAHAYAPGVDPGIAKIYRATAKSIDGYTAQDARMADEGGTR